jgi:hypothetical protein
MGGLPKLLSNGMSIEKPVILIFKKISTTYLFQQSNTFVTSHAGASHSFGAKYSFIAKPTTSALHIS